MRGKTGGLGGILGFCCMTWGEVAMCRHSLTIIPLGGRELLDYTSRLLIA